MDMSYLWWYFRGDINNMVYNKYDEVDLPSPVVFPSDKDKCICAYLEDIGRVTVRVSRFKELLKEHKLIEIVATNY